MGIIRRKGMPITRGKAIQARVAVAKAANLLRGNNSTSSGGYGSSLRRSLPYRGGGPELKFIDTNAVNQTLTLTWNVLLINGVTQGIDYNNRVGRKSMIKSVIFNGNFFNQNTASLSAPNGAYCRAVIIYDSQPNSAATPPSGTTIFAIADANSPMNLNNRDRFQVLMDVRRQVSAFLFNGTGGLAAGNPANAYFKKYRKCNKEMIFSDVNNTLASISTGALYLCLIADATATASIDYYTRIRFTDA